MSHKNMSGWSCPSCGVRRGYRDEKPRPGVLPHGAIHMTVGTVVDGYRVRPANPGDMCRAWPSIQAYKAWLSFQRKEEGRA